MTISVCIASSSRKDPRMFSSQGDIWEITSAIARCSVRKSERSVMTSCLRQVCLALITWCITPAELHAVKLEESAQ